MVWHKEDWTIMMILHVHKGLTDKLSLTDVANNFVSKSPRREQVFGKL